MGDDNGLSIDEREFMCLPPKRQMCVLYQNQVATLELVKGYKFHQKIQYILISACLAGLGIIFKIHLGV